MPHRETARLEEDSTRVIGADIMDPDVIAPDDKDVGLLRPSEHFVGRGRRN